MTSVLDTPTGRPLLGDVLVEQLRRRPDALAAVDDHHAFTYRELDVRAAVVAGRLRRAGVTVGDRVAVTCRHGVGVVAALLGVLRVGAVVVPLDRDMPARRLQAIREDAGVSVVVADLDDADPWGAAAEGVPTGTTVVATSVDEPVGEPDCVPPARELLEADAAFVLYTSGSRGRPKGVVLPHRAVAGLALAAAGTFELTEGDRVLALASIGFSASLEEVFPTLTAGATLVLPGRRRDLGAIDALLEELDRYRVGVVILQTALWHELVHSGRGLPASVRLVGVSGEKVRPDLLPAWAERDVELVHIYGPTECAATVSYHRVPAGERVEALPLGTPIDGARVVVVDDEGDPADEGELLVGGALLADGYLGRPAATAAAFVPDPRAPEPGARRYRSGDRVRRGGSGELSFLGRVDEQLKVHGHRVEPTEIEAALEEHPTISRTAVALREEPVGGRRLVAYLVPEHGATIPTTSDLRRHLAPRLPSAVIPAAFVEVDEIPLTGHRKVDVAALPAPSDCRPALATAYVEPGNPDERAVADLWSRTLGVTPVGLDDDLLDLGGSSLTLTALVGGTASRLGVRVASRDLFARRTVRGHAALVRVARERGDVTGPEPDRAPLPDPAPDDAAPLAASQYGTWFAQRLDPASRAYDTSWTAWLSGPLDTASWNAAVRELVARHEPLRSTIAVRGGRPIVTAGPTVEAGTEDLSHASDPVAAATARAEALLDGRFDLDHGPLFATTLLRVAAEQHLFVVKAHHLVLDGRSREVLLEDLLLLHSRLRAGHRPPPTPRTDWVAVARRQNAALDGPGGQASLDAWADHLDGLVPVRLEAGPAPTSDSAGPRTTLDADVDVGAIARSAGASSFMLLAAAVAVVLYRHTGRTDLALAVPGSGRTWAGSERLVGMFVMTAVLRLEVRPEDTLADLVDRAREEVLAAQDRGQVPADRVIERIAPPRAGVENPLTDVLVAVETDPAPSGPPSGPRVVEVRDVETGSTPFGLSLILVESARGPRLRVDHRRATVGAAEAQAFAEETLAVIRSLRTAPDAPIGPPTSPPATTPDPGPRHQLIDLDDPRTAAVATSVAELWREILGVARIGLEDDFFALGGHSMVAAALVAAAEERFGAPVDLLGLFQEPTVAGMTALVVRSGATSTATTGEEDLLAEIDAMSDEEVAAALAAEEEDR